MTAQQNNISFSLIVCCYNVEHYLDKSLKCLEKQWGDRTDYEILLVNDGSKDGTLAKLNEFESRHPENVRVIDKQQNGGLAAARNSAMDVARGKWIGFFDPDDMLAEGSYVKLLELIDNSEGFDILRFGVEVVNDEDNLRPAVLTEPLAIDWRGTSVEYMLENNFGTCWCYIYRRDLLENRRFPTNMIVEDLLFVAPILLENKMMIKTDTVIYYYIVRTDSATFVSYDYNRLSRQSDDIASAVEILDGFKQGQSEDIQRRLTEKQRLLVHNMSIRMLLANKSGSDVNKIIQSMTKLNLFPLQGGGKMVGIMNYVFTHLWTLPVFRPMYRLFRRVYNYLRY